MSLTNPAYFAYVTSLVHSLSLNISVPETRLVLYAHAVIKFPELNESEEAIKQFSDAMTAVENNKKEPKARLTLKTSS